MPPVLQGTVAVTGATGFIGSHICSALLEAGYSVRAVVRDPSSQEKNAHLLALAGAADRLSLFKGNLDQSGSYDEAFAGVDAVIHTAAVVEIDNVKDPQAQIVKPSIEGTNNVLASVDKTQAVKRFVHTSSIIATFQWDRPATETLSESDWNTASTVARGDAYGFAKVEAEKIVLNHKSETCDCIAILPGINLGPCLTKNHTKASAVVVRQFLYGNSQPEYFGHFVDVRDTAAAFVKALAVELPAEDARRFIVASDDGQMQVSALEAPLKQLFPNYQIAANPYPGPSLRAVIGVPLLWRLFLSEFRRAMLDMRARLNNSRSKDVLGVQYRTLDETLRDTVESMKAHVKIRTLQPEPAESA